MAEKETERDEDYRLSSEASHVLCLVCASSALSVPVPSGDGEAMLKSVCSTEPACLRLHMVCRGHSQPWSARVPIITAIVVFPPPE